MGENRVSLSLHALHGKNSTAGFRLIEPVKKIGPAKGSSLFFLWIHAPAALWGTLGTPSYRDWRW